MSHCAAPGEGPIIYADFGPYDLLRRPRPSGLSGSGRGYLDRLLARAEATPTKVRSVERVVPLFPQGRSLSELLDEYAAQKRPDTLTPITRQARARLRPAPPKKVSARDVAKGAAERARALSPERRQEIAQGVDMVLSGRRRDAEEEARRHDAEMHAALAEVNEMLAQFRFSL